MRKKDLLNSFVIVFFYLSILFFTHKEIFTYHFDKTLIKRYFLSQDITHEVSGKRLFLSDEEIYLASGYLYAKGEDPAVYNFPVPPFVKYLYGFSMRWFGNPYIVQIFFGVIALLLIYHLGKKVYGSSLVGVLAGLLLIVDPLFIDSSSHAMLDLPEAMFLLLYITALFFPKRNYFFQGVILGLFMGTKSLSTPLFFVVLLFFYFLFKKELNIKLFVKHLIIAGIIYTLFYTRSFFLRNGMFNIAFFALKTIKYRIVHNVTSFPGASLVLFLTSYFQTWWDRREFLSVATWSLFWPIGLSASIFQAKEYIKKRRIDGKVLFAAVPILYFLYLGIQAPFPRYFLIILPFLYLNLAYISIKFLLKKSPS